MITLQCQSASKKCDCFRTHIKNLVGPDKAKHLVSLAIAHQGCIALVIQCAVGPINTVQIFTLREVCTSSLM